MGRGGGHGGGGGGHHRSGGHSSFSGGSHRSSGFGGRSSYSGGYRSYRGPGYNPYRSTSYRSSYGYTNSYGYSSGAYGSGMPVYRRNSVGGIGCLTVVAMFILFLIVVGFISTGTSKKGVSFSQIDEKVVAQSCEEYYTKVLKSPANAMLLYVPYSDKKDDEYPYVWYGDNAARFVEPSLDQFWSYYDSYYDYDMGYQLNRTLISYSKYLEGTKEKIEQKPFISDYDVIASDSLNYIDSKELFIDGAKTLYDTTNIQFYVVTADYDTLPAVKEAKQERNAKITKAFVIILLAGAGVFSGVLVSKQVKKKKAEEQKKLEEEIKILNTPLDEMAGVEFESDNVDDLLKKYQSTEKQPYN